MLIADSCATNCIKYDPRDNLYKAANSQNDRKKLLFTVITAICILIAENMPLR